MAPSGSRHLLSHLHSMDSHLDLQTPYTIAMWGTCRARSSPHRATLLRAMARAGEQRKILTGTGNGCPEIPDAHSSAEKEKAAMAFQS